VSGGTSDVFGSLARELAAGYRVAIELQPGDMDGALHRVRVETTAPRTTVRSHQHFLGTTAGYRPPAERLALVLRNQRMLSGLPLKVSTYTRQSEQAGRLEIVIAGDIGPDEPGPAQVAYRLTDERGREVLSAESEVAIEAGPGGQPAVGRFLARGEVPAGSYLLKVAAVGPRGGVGSVEHPVNASLWWFDSVGVGDLFLAPGTGQDGGRVRPVADCEVAGQPLLALLELYGRQGAPPAALRPTFEVLGTGGESPLVDVPMDATVSEDRSRLVAQTTVATSLLPPGDYVGRVVVSAGRDRLEVARRPFRVLPVDAAADALDPGAGTDAEAAFAVVDALRSLVPRFDVKDVLQPDATERDLLKAVRRSGATSPAVTGIPEAARAGALSFDRLDAAVEQEAPLVAAMGRGLSLLEAGRFDVAAPQFNRATTLASDFLTALVYLGACYAGQGRDADAASVWQTALVAEDGSPRVYRFASDALMRRGQVDEAIELLREATATWPDAADVAYRLALALALADQRAEALRTLNASLESQQPPPDAVFLALLLLQHARLSGQPVVTAEADRDRMDRLAAAYLTGSGTRKALVRAWAEAQRTRPR
jgi:tetratricopeptide (TPR) repeat protein